MEQIRRIPPCPEYDIEGRQAWYERMAAAVPAELLK